MISEAEIHNELKNLIIKNIDSFFKLKETSLNATSIGVRDVLSSTAQKKAVLIQDLSAAFHKYQNEDISRKVQGEALYIDSDFAKQKEAMSAA